MLPSCSSSGKRKAEGKGSSAFTFFVVEGDRTPLIPKLCGCCFAPPTAPAPGIREEKGQKCLLPPCHCTMAPLMLGKHCGLRLGSTCWDPCLSCLLIKTAMGELNEARDHLKHLCYILSCCILRITRFATGVSLWDCFSE